MKLSSIAAVFVAAVAVPALIFATWDNDAKATAQEPVYSSVSSVTFACGNVMEEWEMMVSDGLSDAAIEAMIDGACASLESHVQGAYEPSDVVLTCFDQAGMVTEGNDWKECFPIPVQ